MEKNYVLDEIMNRGWKLEDNFQDTNYYYSKGDRLLSYTTPHSGNEYSHLIRAEHREDFDRWSSTQVEEFVKDADNLILALVEADRVVPEED